MGVWWWSESLTRTINYRKCGDCLELRHHLPATTFFLFLTTSTTTYIFLASIPFHETLPKSKCETMVLILNFFHCYSTTWAFVTTAKWNNTCFFLILLYCLKVKTLLIKWFLSLFFLLIVTELICLIQLVSCSLLEALYGSGKCLLF